MTVTEVFIAEIWAFRYTLVLLVSEFGLLDNGSVSHFPKKKKNRVCKSVLVCSCLVCYKSRDPIGLPNH